MKTASIRKLLVKGMMVACLTAAVSLQAQSSFKLGVIDLVKTFDSYWKTKQADANIKDRGADFDKSLKSMTDDFEKAKEEYRKLTEGAADQAVSSDEREKRRKGAEAKLSELREIGNSIEQFKKQATTTLGEQQRRMRDNILKEIREVINTKAKAGGYTSVIDISALSTTATPVILFNSGGNDITDDVISTLNVTAPANLPKTDAKPATDAGKTDKK
jgi:outer membrane protein